MKRAELFVHKATGTGLHGLEIEAFVGGDRRYGFGFGVVAIKGHRASSIRKEVDLVADPDWLGVVAVIAGNLFEIESFEVHDPNGDILATVIALPGRLPAAYGFVGEGLAVG